MVPISLVSFALLPFLAYFPSTSARPAGPPSGAAALEKSLSRDLASTLQGASRDIAGAAAGLQQQIIQTSSLIDDVAALDDDSPVSRRAAAACKIADLLFPGRVFAANDPEYQEAQDFNW